jgi:hypothetical protein
MFGGFKPIEPHKTFYQATFRGLKTPVALPLNLMAGNSASCGKIVPDQYAIQQLKKKEESYRQDLLRVSSRTHL